MIMSLMLFYLRVSTCKSVALVLCQKTMGWSLLVKNESLPQVKEFKYFRVLFINEGKKE